MEEYIKECQQLYEDLAPEARTAYTYELSKILDTCGQEIELLNHKYAHSANITEEYAEILNERLRMRQLFDKLKPLIFAFTIFD